MARPAAVKRGALRRWRERGGRRARLVLRFEDVMAFALSLLAAPPAELAVLQWTFADRKRLLDHLLTSGKAAQSARPEDLDQLEVEIVLPQRDIDRLLRFARRELPKAAPDALLLDRVLAALEAASHRLVPD